MTSLAWLIPAALLLGGLGLAAFLWSLRSGQFDDLDGASWRALQDKPLTERGTGRQTPTGEPDGSRADDDAAR
ncbi:MAG: cbb3-type cytochrome oxidase assembly protein CcoS [Hyphomicrobiaceae bacterium]